MTMTDTITTTVQPREIFGTVVTTRTVHETVPAPIVQRLLDRHFINDWGDLDDEDAQMNSDAVNNIQGRIMSSYSWADLPEKIWIISYLQSDPELQKNPDYCNTCVLFPSEY